MNLKRLHHPRKKYIKYSNSGHIDNARDRLQAASDIVYLAWSCTQNQESPQASCFQVVLMKALHQTTAMTFHADYFLLIHLFCAVTTNMHSIH